MLSLFALWLAISPPSAPPVRGMTISCQTYGREWGTDAFAAELDRLQALGVNWVAIHPYARISADGEVSSRLDPSDPPRWLTRPIAEAHARGMQIMVKPHLAYWGSPFSWRGAIDFEDPAQLDRFFSSYTRWVVALAQVTQAADAFVVGTELDRLLPHDVRWRAVIAAVRALFPGKLTYAANWTDFARVPFWDALDAVGVQAYFPLAPAATPPSRVSSEQLLAGWAEVLPALQAVHRQTGKPVIFTELGYTDTAQAAATPWAHGRHGDAAAQALQRRCLETALAVLRRERAWLHGAFVWKWFPGPAPGEDFVVDTEGLRAVIQRAWRPETR